MAQPAKEVQKAMDEHARCNEVGLVQATETGSFPKKNDNAQKGNSCSKIDFVPESKMALSQQNHEEAKDG